MALIQFTCLEITFKLKLDSMKSSSRTLIILILTFVISLNIHAHAWEKDSVAISNYENIAKSIYHSLGNNDLSLEAFSFAYLGYKQLLLKDVLEKKNILTIIDFNKSSKEERLFIIDLQKRIIIHESLVAHGKNSGWDIPKSFSNAANSHQSSLGFYVTGETYMGKHGLSLKLDGLEKGINDNARKRHIVIHSADYVSDSFIHQVGRLGRSFGCPSLPSENYNEIIDLIKERSVIFIYSKQKEYFNKSAFL